MPFLRSFSKINIFLQVTVYAGTTFTLPYVWSANLNF